MATEIPQGAIEAIRERQGFKVGSHSWEGIRPTVEKNLQAALPALHAAWLKEAKEWLTIRAENDARRADRAKSPRQQSWYDGSADANRKALTALGPKEEEE